MAESVIDDLMNGFAGCSGKFVDGFKKRAGQMATLYSQISDILTSADKTLEEMQRDLERQEREFAAMLERHHAEMDRLNASLEDVLKDAPPLDPELIRAANEGEKSSERKEEVPHE